MLYINRPLEGALSRLDWPNACGMGQKLTAVDCQSLKLFDHGPVWGGELHGIWVMNSVSETHRLKHRFWTHCFGKPRKRMADGFSTHHTSIAIFGAVES